MLFFWQALLSMSKFNVVFERIGATPGHVTDHFFLAAFHLPWGSGNLMNQSHHLANVPMAKPMNVQVNADSPAQPFPMRNESIISIGFASGRQKQRLVVA